MERAIRVYERLLRETIVILIISIKHLRNFENILWKGMELSQKHHIIGYFSINRPHSGEWIRRYPILYKLVLFNK